MTLYLTYWPSTKVSLGKKESVIKMLKVTGHDNLYGLLSLYLYGYFILGC